MCSGVHAAPAQLAAMSNWFLEASAKASGCGVWNFPLTYLERLGLESPGGASDNGCLSCFDVTINSFVSECAVSVSLPRFVKILL